MRHLSLSPSSPEYPTTSELHRARECVAPWALGLPEVRETNEWAEFGKRCHVGAEMLAHGQGIIEALARALPEPPHKQTDAIVSAVETMVPIIERDTLECKQGAEGVWYVEQGIKWRPGVLEDEAALCDRQPGERLRGWFSGTADLVYVRADGVLVVADWKFGPREHITGEPAKDSCQGFFLATAFAALLEIRGSSAGVVVARFERRMVHEDGIEVDAVDITQGEIDAFAEQLRGLAKRIGGGLRSMPPDPIDWTSAACGHCKAKAECPAWNTSKNRFALGTAEPAALESLFRAPTNTDEARRMHEAIVVGEPMVAEWKRLRDAYVLTHPEGVSIGLGLKLKAIPSKDREALDTPEALDVIERIAGPGAVEVQRKSGVTRIAKALRDGAGKDIASSTDRGKTKKAAEENGFAELVKAGAVIDKGKKLTVRVVRSDEEE